MVAKKMDLDHYLHLRSYNQPPARMYKALVGALIVHLLFGLNFYIDSFTQSAEIPDFINVKLTAGFETVENKQEKKKREPVKKETLLPVNKNKLVKQAERVKEKQQPVEKEARTETSKATTFVAADSRPYMLDNPKPVYPATARRRGMQGVVILKVKVSEKGDVKTLNIFRTSGYRLLDQSAVASVRNWRFVPAKQGEKSVASTLNIPIRFKLENI